MIITGIVVMGLSEDAEDIQEEQVMGDILDDDFG